MSWFGSIFSWWNGATFGTRMSIAGARAVGRDGDGNAYYTSADGKRRWVVYNGVVDASRIPPDWHLWMHGSLRSPPSEKPLAAPRWVKPPQPNLTGTPRAHMPSGSLAKVGRRARATGDYEAWTPDA